MTSWPDPTRPGVPVRAPTGAAGLRPLLTAHQVAMALALDSALSFHRRRRALEADHGFPEPVPGLGLRWDPAAIEAWLARRRGAPAGGQDEGAEALLVARARAIG
jgi:predicted DNA-binding transcriptional regulator AlpA